MAKFGDILRGLRLENELTQSELGKRIGLSTSAIGMYERGEREPDFEKLEKIAGFFNVNLNFLLGKEAVVSNKTIVGIRIPVLGKVAAGIPITAVENILDYEEISSDMASSGDYVALQIKGRSMEPRMWDGDVVIIRRQDTVENGEVAVVMVDGDEATVKKVQFQKDGILLRPFNPDFEPLFYSKSEIENIPVRIFGKVVECRQKY